MSLSYVAVSSKQTFLSVLMSNKFHDLCSKIFLKLCRFFHPHLYKIKNSPACQFRVIRIQCLLTKSIQSHEKSFSQQENLTWMGNVLRSIMGIFFCKLTKYVASPVKELVFECL